MHGHSRQSDPDVGWLENYPATLDDAPTVFGNLICDLHHETAQTRSELKKCLPASTKHHVTVIGRHPSMLLPLTLNIRLATMYCISSRFWSSAGLLGNQVEPRPTVRTWNQRDFRPIIGRVDCRDLEGSRRMISKGCPVQLLTCKAKCYVVESFERTGFK